MNNEISVTANTILEELYKFSEDMVYLGPEIGDDRLSRFETQIGFSLPEDFKFIISKVNGISLSGMIVFGLNNDLEGSSLDAIYEFEHEGADSKMPNSFLPFSPDGAGNHYCLDLATLDDGRCKVVFWQHDLRYESIYQVEICNNDFCDWLQEVMIGWTLEDYNYDGSTRE